MNVNEIASKLCKMEGKKHQASIGDVREILKILVSWEAAAIIKAWKDGSLEAGAVDEKDFPIFCLAAAAKEKFHKHKEKQQEKFAIVMVQAGFEEGKKAAKKATKKKAKKKKVSKSR